MVWEEEGDMNQRRMMWWFSALLVAGVLLSVSTGAPPARGQIATPSTVTAAVPDWRFVVHGMQDPYLGVLTYAPEPAEGMRYVGFDIEVVNASDQPLTVGSNVVSLRDDEGFIYRSGNVAGSEPQLQPVTLPGGERVRGWVWFRVLEDATLSQLLLAASAPELRLGLDQVAPIPGTPTPTPTSTPAITPSPVPTATPPATPEAPPPPTEPPAPTPTAIPAPAATPAPTSVIIDEPAETPEGAEAATATPVATATAPAAVTGIAPGGSVISGIAATNLRDSPALAGAIVATLPLGTELTITGPSVSGDGFTWWPVTVVATGAEGYVVEDLLVPPG
jgi:hypothetical protein